MQVPQIQLLDHFAIHRPDLFQKKLCVPPETFDDILNQISNHHVFHNQSNNPQLPVAVQLAIFLNRVGHYGNASSPKDISQWAGVSVGSVINCMNRIMAALLAEHNNFISFPTLNSIDAAHAQAYALKTLGCPEWQNGILAIDGSFFNLYQRPGLFGDAFYSRKSHFSLNCQTFDYSLGHTGSAHDAYTFRSTHIYQNHQTLLGNNHWIWADSAYPIEPWCIPPFKKPIGGALTPKQKEFNTVLSKVCV
ncbi:hypothetical protein BDR06DRAFT_979248 [Suillus hirtellus]|nr:hypothetical protein BDR06DRAFT_979248 [Suillus hirtellus]